jgi:uncharacterized protein YndB with AHSA1/START domain
MPIHSSVHVDRRFRSVNAPPETVFRVICRLGGKHGWFTPHWVWQLRGLMDIMVGGPGLRVGRRHPEEMRVGDTVDCWHVVAVEPPARLELHTLMKLPGAGLLEFRLDPEKGPSRTTLLTQSAEFAPHGLWGTIYWMVLLPIHDYVFSRMIRGIGRAAEGEVATMRFSAGYTAKEPGLQGPASEYEATDRT